MDTVEHHLFYCTESKQFWSSLKIWMVANLNFGFDFVVCEVLFRFPTYSVPDTELININGKVVFKPLLNQRKTDIFLFEFVSIIREKL